MLSRKDLLILLASSRKRNRNLAQQVRFYKKRCNVLQQESRRYIRTLLILTYSAIGDMLKVWDRQLKEKGMDDPLLRAEMELIIEKHLGNEENLGEIGKVVNLAFDHVMDRIQQEESFDNRDRKLFCYMVTQLDNRSLRILLKLNCTSTVGTQKSRLKRKLSHYTVKGRKEYLALIDKKNK